MFKIFFLLFLFVYPLSSLILNSFGGRFINRFPEIDVNLSSFSLEDYFSVISYFMIIVLYSLWLSCIASFFMNVKEKYLSKTNNALAFTLIYLSIIYLLETINGIEFPGSNYKHFYLDEIIDYSFVNLGTVFMMFVGGGVFLFNRLSYREKVYGVMLCAIPLGLLLFNYSINFVSRVIAPNKVNEIAYLIGIDAVRADAYEDLRENSKFINDNQEVYLNAYTPVGRTYASWNVLTTGEAPLNNGIRFNLSAKAPKCTLFKEFEKNGWNIVYGSDEKRFNHIGENCELKNNIGASAQALDFIGASPFFDYPMLNLLSGYDYLFKKFLPFHVHNRANYITYDPKRAAEFYANKISAMLTSGDNLVVFHLTLPHLPWEHKWSYDKKKTNHEKYEQMVMDVGSAVDKFMGFTAVPSNRLSGVIWSDHGESFSGVHSHGKYCCNDVSGHGTSEKIVEQYNNFISFSKNIDREIAYRHDSFITTMDVFPTLAKWYIGIDISSDGCNLLDSSSCKKRRGLTIETGYTLDAMLKAKVNIDEIVHKSVGGYQIQNGRLSLKPEFEKSLMLEKRYSVVSGDTILRN